MDIENIDVVQSLNDMTWKFCLSTELWEVYQKEEHIIDFMKMKKIRFFDGDSTKISKDISKVPNKTGGIYIYVLENPIVPNNGYIMYVGRALYTKYENLRTRARSHFNQYKTGDENDRLTSILLNLKLA